MGYLFLIIALSTGLLKGYCGKKTSGYTSEIGDAMNANLIRMILCVLLGFAYIVLQGQVRFMIQDVKFFVIAALSGISVTAFAITWLLCVKSGAYMMVDVFLMLGVFIPLLAGCVFFQEKMEINKWIGMAALVVATLIMCSYNNSQKGKISVRSLVLLIVCGMANGISDFSQKLFVKKVEYVPISIFNFYTYVFAVITIVIALRLLNKNEKDGSGKKSILPDVWRYVFVMSVCLYLNSYFKTKAALYLDSVTLYPLNQGSALILSTIMSATLFREKLTIKCVVGLIVAFVGLLFINFF